MFYYSKNKTNPRRITECGFVLQCITLGRNTEQTFRDPFSYFFFRKINLNVQKPPLQSLPEVEFSFQSFLASPSRARAAAEHLEAPAVQWNQELNNSLCSHQQVSLINLSPLFSRSWQVSCYRKQHLQGRKILNNSFSCARSDSLLSSWIAPG